MKNIVWLIQLKKKTVKSILKKLTWK